jgi:large subunit ribosomal protein L4
MKVTVYQNSGKKTKKKVELIDEIFAIEPNDHAIYLDVKQYLANQRQGTHKSKERAEISGSTRKIKRQKGTGTARAGSIKSPLFRGGGRAFGPRPRDHGFKLNKKLKVLARKSALSYKSKEEGIMVLEDFNFEAPKTKEFLKMLTSLELENKKTLLVLPNADKNILLSSRNLPKAKVTTVDSLHTYDLLHADRLLISESSVEKIENLLK